MNEFVIWLLVTATDEFMKLLTCLFTRSLQSTDARRPSVP